MKEVVPGAAVGAVLCREGVVGRRGVALSARLFGLVMFAAVCWWMTIFVRNLDLDATYDLAVVADRMLTAGETFSPEILGEVEDRVAPSIYARTCDGGGLRNLAVVRVALAENAIKADDPEGAERLLAKANDAATKSIACNPFSTISWTILAWIEFIREDDTPHLRDLIAMSYRTGPYEGWSLMRRNELLLHLLPNLDSPALAQLRSQIEWVIALGAIDMIAEQYVNAGPQQRAFLHEIFSSASERTQRRTADFIRRAGGDISLPLVEPLGSRPWK